MDTAGFIEVSVEVGQEALEAVADFLISAGAGGVSYDEGVRSIVRAYFRPERAEDVLLHLEEHLAKLPAFGLDAGPTAVQSRFVADVDWALAWREFYHVTHFGRRVVVRPAWEAYEPTPGEIVIDMDPGMAFGTGAHPTTGLCLSALDGMPLSGARVADIGTGSGILAIAAAKLGAAWVDAVDIDAEAIVVARRNVEENGVADRVHVSEGELDMLRANAPYDVVVMNIIADVIIQSLPALKALLHDETLLLLSGIIETREEAVEQALRANGLRLQERRQQGEWLLLQARR